MNILDVVSHMVCAPPIPLCRCGIKAARGDTEAHVTVFPLKLSLQEEVSGSGPWAEFTNI